MKRRVTERLEGYSFGVAILGSANGDENAVVAEVVFVDDGINPGHTVTVPLTAQGKCSLIAQLTGGIEVASQIPSG